MAQTPDDPLLPGSAPDPFDAPLPFAPVLPSPAPSDAASEAPAEAPLPFAPPVPEGQPAPPPVSLVPESVRRRSADDLPFTLGAGGFGAPVGEGPDHDDAEGIPTGLPDLRSVAGVEGVESAPPTPAPARPVSPAPGAQALPHDLDDDLMALPSPSMMERSPFAEEDDEEVVEDVVVGHPPTPPPGSPVYSDDTEQEQLPPTPIGGLRRDGPDVVPARVLMEALEATERRHMVHLAIAFCLGAGTSVLGFVAARWALTAF